MLTTSLIGLDDANAIWEVLAEIFQRCGLSDLENFSVEGTTMRFFVGTCIFCLAIASVGCMTNNWTSPLFTKPSMAGQNQKEVDVDRLGFFHQTFGKQSGSDQRAREIENNLGYEH